MRYWAIPKKGTITAVECYSHDLDLSEDKREITEQQFLDFIASMPADTTPPPPSLQQQLDELKAKVAAMEAQKVV